jgi:transcriptional regulator with XRE-family HTH domain
VGEKPVRSVRTAEYDALTRLLKQLRVEANLTQKQLCDRLGQDATYVSKLERGSRRLDVVELLELAHALSLDASEVVRRLQAAVASELRQLD